MTRDEYYDAFEAEEQAGWDRRRAIFLKAVAHARNEALEEAAKYMDDCAHDWSRIRDPGMANHCRKHASAIRALITTRQGE